MTRPTAALSVRVTPAPHEYPILIEDGAAFKLRDLLGGTLGSARVALISDTTVAGLYADAVRSGIGGRVDLYTFPAGEASKSVVEWNRLSERMLADGHDRHSVVVALGGGVTGDLAGFVAATFMRGIPVVQVPTTVLAMVDASVGGKTAINTPVGKNLLGAFHAPHAVVMDPLLLETLPRALRGQGFVEAVKHGAVRSVDHFEQLMSLASGLMDADPPTVRRVLPETVGIKIAVVEEDERETGVRAVLNFGHTLGHALERLTDFGVPHGSAVAIGMVAEARLGERSGVSRPGTADRLDAALRSFGLETSPPETVDVTAWVEGARSDKKGRDGGARYVLLRSIGDVDPGDNWLHTVPESEAVAALTRG